MNIALLKTELVRDEGLRLKPYRDTVGKLSIGVGRNLDDVGITAEEAAVLLDHDIASALAGVRKALPWFDRLTEARQRVLVNMAFNLGLGGLLGFRFTLAAMERGDYTKAAAGMRASKWAKQVGARAERLALTMERG